MPDAKPKRKWFQFSLRLLLLVVVADVLDAGCYHAGFSEWRFSPPKTWWCRPSRIAWNATIALTMLATVTLLTELLVRKLHKAKRHEE